MHDPDRSTIWPYDEQGEPRDFYYSRTAHPAGVAAEAELGEREGGDALLYASGMGAITNMLLALARPGATLALAEGCYYGTSKLLGLLAHWDISYVEFDQTGPAPDADILWLEAPAEPGAVAARLGTGARAPRARRLRRDARDARLPARARRGCRRRPALGDQVPDGTTRRCSAPRSRATPS